MCDSLCQGSGFAQAINLREHGGRDDDAGIGVLTLPGFIRSLHDFSIAKWDHEPKAPASWTHSKRFARFRDLEHDARAFGVRGACSRFCHRFMGSLDLQFWTRIGFMNRPGISHGFKAFRDWERILGRFESLGWFTGSSLFLGDLLTAHEPPGRGQLVPVPWGRAVPTPRFMEWNTQARRPCHYLGIGFGVQVRDGGRKNRRVNRKTLVRRTAAAAPCVNLKNCPTSAPPSPRRTLVRAAYDFNPLAVTTATIARRPIFQPT